MPKKRPSTKVVRGVLAPLCLSVFLCGLHARLAQGASAIPAAVSLPDLVTEPPFNLGNTSFYDGFGQTTPGFAFLDYGRWQHLTSISNSKGDSVPVFHNPQVTALINILQFAWITPLKAPHGAFSFMVLLPVVDLNSSFDQPGGNLRANNFGIGDLGWGPIYQSKPWVWGKQVFSWRAEFDVFSPSGSFDRTKDINQSSGFWSIDPHVEFTYLPAPGWEISSRIHYLYNFSTTKISNPPIMADFPIRNGQAGQAASINFTASREVAKDFALGLNGFYFQQFTKDRLNGITLPHTEKNQVYLGPGAHWQISKNNILNFNLYLPVSTHGVANGPQLNIQFIRPML